MTGRTREMPCHLMKPMSSHELISVAETAPHYPRIFDPLFTFSPPLAVTMSDYMSNLDPKPPQFEIQKTFPPKGSWRLFRLLSQATFTCAQCGKEKKSKLVAFQNEDWDKLVCNGCYGQTLSGKWILGLIGRGTDVESIYSAEVFTHDASMS
jgi:hypothetical protein